MKRELGTIRYMVGHPAYCGVNRATYHATIKDAERELALRGVSRAHFRERLRELRANPWHKRAKLGTILRTCRSNVVEFTILYREKEISQ